MDRRAWIAVAATFVAALVIGVVAARTLDSGGGSSETLPAAGRRIPLVGPADGTLGPGAAADVPSPAPDGVPAANVVGDVARFTSGGSGGSGASGSDGDARSGAGSGSAGSGSAGGGHGGGTTGTTAAGGTTGTTAAGGTSPTTAPGTGSPPVPGVGSGSDPTIAGVDLRGIHQFIDPCTLHRGGCPHRALGGTILPINGPRAFAITGGGTGDCPGVDPSRRDEEVVIWITLTEPAPLELEVRGHENPRQFFQNLTPVLADAERARWEGAPDTDVTYCAELRSAFMLADSTHRYTVDATAYEHNDRALVHHATFEITGATRDRPRMDITPGDVWPTAGAVATSIPGGPERVPSVVLVAYDDHCTDAAAAAARPYTGGIPIDVAAPGYAYDRAYTEWVQPYFVTATELSTGRQVAFEPDQRYVLCVYWHNPAGDLMDWQQVAMRAPDRYRMEVRVKSVDFPHAVPFDLTLSMWDGACTIHLTGNAAHAQYLDPRFSSGEDFDSYPYGAGDPANDPRIYPNGPTSCDQPDPFTIPASSFSLGNPDGSVNLDVDATLRGVDYPAAIWVPISPCPPGGGSCPYTDSFSEDYTVPLGTAGSVTLDIAFLHSILYHGYPTTGGSSRWQVDPYYW